MKADYCKYTLDFKRPGGTSRGVLTSKETYFLILQQEGKWGLGECALFRGLSFDDRPGYEQQLQWVCDHVHEGPENLTEALRDWPSIAFGLEQAYRSLRSSDPMVLFSSGFIKDQPIPINGLVWMGEPAYMKEQIFTLHRSGFDCLKLKIGALAFEQELFILEEVRKDFSPGQLEIRVDANGAFQPQEAMERLEALSELDLHSIEQPVAAGQWEVMAALCQNSPLPIALDEELIGITDHGQQREMLTGIRPQYIILKPSLLGGFRASERWIRLAEDLSIGWWVTSALESNVGLNAIAQWTATLGVDRYQGLGTGSLFTNNFESPLEVRQGKLWHDGPQQWNISKLQNICI